MLDYLANKSDFFTAPALHAVFIARRVGCVASLNVYSACATS